MIPIKNFLTAATALAVIVVAAPQNNTFEQRSDAPGGNKRGLAYEWWQSSVTNILARPGSASWAYNWGTQMNAPKFQQIPMYWGPGNQGDAAGVMAKINRGNTPWVLGYNEPDEIHANGGCNASPQQARNAWGNDMFKFANRGVKLVCPGITSWNTNSGHAGYAAGLTWLRQFAGNNPAQLRCSAQALHWYGDQTKSAAQQAQLFINYIAYAHQQVKQIFRVPEMEIWVTEFSPLPVHNTQVMADFLKIVIPWLDAQPWIGRYSPFMASDLVSSGNLNLAGHRFINPNF
jgi:hypothetical protein